MYTDKIRTAIEAFRQRCGGSLGALLRVYDNPTEEIADGLARKKPVKLFMGRQLATPNTGAKDRLEENYLFDTRRFAAGPVLAMDYLFFQSAVGAPGVNNGFVSPMVMSEVETNMDVAAQVPQGRDFVMTQVGISFNADATAEDVSLMLEIGALRFSKQGGQYTLHHGPGLFWPGGQGATSATTTANANTNNGTADIRAVRKLAVPRILKAKDTFNYSYFVPRGVRNLDNSTVISLGAATLMRVWLWGGQQDTIPT